MKTLRLKELGRITIGGFSILLLSFVLLVGCLIMTGCPEAEQMVGPVVTEPAEKPDKPKTPEEPTTVGDEKQPKPEDPTEEPTKPEPEEPAEEPATPVEEPEPELNPAVTIASVTPADDGSVTISGTSADLPAETEITITLGETVTTTTTTDSDGNWTITIPAAETEQITAGTITVTVSAEDVSDNSSFTIEPKVDIVESVTFYENVQLTKEMTEDSQIRLGDLDTIYTKVVLKESIEISPQPKFAIDGVATSYSRTKKEFSLLSGEYKEVEKGVYLCLYIPLEESPAGIFDLIVEGVKHTAPTKIRPVEVYPTRESIYREWIEIGSKVPDHQSTNPHFKRFFGFPREFASQHLIDIFLEERPNDGRGLKYWRSSDAAVEYFYLQQHNPDADEEMLEELFRESVRAGEVVINSVSFL